MNIQHSIICGRLTAKPELKVMTNGEYICSFTIAVNLGSGEKKFTEFNECVAYGKQAETLCKYFDKGSEIYVVCNKGWRTREWTDRDGTKRRKIEHRVTDFYFVTPKNAQGAPDTQASKENPDFGQISAPNFEVTDDQDLPF